jgi:hypothetical protein
VLFSGQKKAEHQRKLSPFKKKSRKTKKEEMGQKYQQLKYKSKGNVNRGKFYSPDFRKTFILFLQLELLHLEFGLFCPCDERLVLCVLFLSHVM